MRISNAVLVWTICFTLVACSGGSDEKSMDEAADSLLADTSAMLDSSGIITSNGAPIDSSENLDFVFNDIITTMRSKGDLSKLNNRSRRLPTVVQI